MSSSRKRAAPQPQAAAQSLDEEDYMSDAFIRYGWNMCFSLALFLIHPCHRSIDPTVSLRRRVERTNLDEKGTLDYFIRVDIRELIVLPISIYLMASRSKAPAPATRVESDAIVGLKLPQRMALKREEALAKPIPEDNIGHKLLQKMGYK
jgi:hypothetical protein